MAVPKNKYPLIGELALKHGLIVKETLELAWKSCAKAQDPVTAFADLLLEQKLISSLDLKRLINASRAMTIRKKDVKFGTIAIEKGYISTSILKLALDEQKKELTLNKRSKLLGDILVEAGMITTSQRDDLLTEQNRHKELNRLIEKEKQITAALKPEEKLQPLTQNHNLTTALPLERGMKLTIPQDAIAAFISKTDEFDDSITSHEIKTILAKQNVVFGIVDETLINGFIKSKGFKTKPFRIALGIKPQRGKDATIKYFFDTDRLKVGKIDPKGVIDFKERGEIPKVAANDVLAEKTPLVEGRDGKNVFGETTVVSPAKDIKMKYEKGARLSTDGLKIIARIDGEPKLSWSGSVSVLDEVTTDNVDYESGHIDYKGNVKVKGIVQSGFKVSGENVRATEIDGGIIHAEGDLSVTGGINEAIIYAKGNVWAKFIHKSTILCMGDIYTTREIVESTIDTSGACVINQGKIISSTINAKMGIFAQNVGTERSIPSTLKVGEDIFVLKELTEIKKNIALVRQQLVKCKEKKSNLEAELLTEQKKTTKLAHIQDTSISAQRATIADIASLNQFKDQEKLNDMRAKLQMLKRDAATAEEDLNSCFEKVEIIEENLKALDSTISTHKGELSNLILEQENLAKWSKANPGVALVDVSQELMAGTKVLGCHSELTIKEHLKRAKIRELLTTKPGDDQDKGWWSMQVTPS